MKTTALAALTLALASCTTSPRNQGAYRNDFLNNQNAAAPTAADRYEHREERREERRANVQDFSYRRGTW